MNLNPSKLSQYAKEMPDETRLLLKGLSDESNLGIIIALLKNGKMNFNEMKKKFELSSSSLSNRLNELQDGNLITNFYEKTTGKGFSYYDVTDIPEQVFESIFKILFMGYETHETSNLDSRSIRSGVTQPLTEKYFKEVHGSATEKKTRRISQTANLNRFSSIAEINDIGSS